LKARTVEEIVIVFMAKKIGILLSGNVGHEGKGETFLKVILAKYLTLSKAA
jgi:hypothetical protein